MWLLALEGSFHGQPAPKQQSVAGGRLLIPLRIRPYPPGPLPGTAPMHETWESY